MQDGKNIFDSDKNILETEIEDIWMGGGVCSSLNISNEKHTMLSYDTTITLILLQYVHTVNRNITVTFDFVN